MQAEVHYHFCYYISTTSFSIFYEKFGKIHCAKAQTIKEK